MVKTVTVGDITFGEGKPKILVPIVGKTASAILTAAEEIRQCDCDVVEWRIDHFEEVSEPHRVAELSLDVKKRIGKPLLITFRTHKEGGVFEQSDGAYCNLYSTLIADGSLDLLDVELFMPEENVQQLLDQAHAKGIKVIMCNHDFDKTPSKEEIVKRLTLMEEKGADICKIAVMPHSNHDVITLLEATAKAREQLNNPLITMSMGSLGMVSRVSGELFGSCATFGAAQEASAPGQVSVDVLRSMLSTLSLR